jgi:hypothetical protein
VTKHKKPRYQLYQPGFNAGNSCWLEGEWLTVSREEFERRKITHTKMYGSFRGLKQHHRDEPTPLDKLTVAQKQAYEFYSGDHLFDGPWGERDVPWAQTA